MRLRAGHDAAAKAQAADAAAKARRAAEPVARSLVNPLEPSLTIAERADREIGSMYKISKLTEELFRKDGGKKATELIKTVEDYTGQSALSRSRRYICRIICLGHKYPNDSLFQSWLVYVTSLLKSNGNRAIEDLRRTMIPLFQIMTKDKSEDNLRYILESDFVKVLYK